MAWAWSGSGSSVSLRNGRGFPRPGLQRPGETSPGTGFIGTGGLGAWPEAGVFRHPSAIGSTQLCSRWGKDPAPARGLPGVQSPAAPELVLSPFAAEGRRCCPVPTFFCQKCVIGLRSPLLAPLLTKAVGYTRGHASPRWVRVWSHSVLPWCLLAGVAMAEPSFGCSLAQEGGGAAAELAWCWVA